MKNLAFAAVAALLVAVVLALVPFAVTAQPSHDPNDSIVPYAEAAALVEHDTNVISPNCRAVYVSTAGNVVVDMARAGTDITFTAVPAGTTIPIRIQRFKTASTATGVCLY